MDYQQTSMNVNQETDEGQSQLIKQVTQQQTIIKKTILVVDDDQSHVSIIISILNKNIMLLLRQAALRHY